MRLRRSDSGAELQFLLNYAHEERTVSLPSELSSHLDGVREAGSLVLEPYGVALLG